MQLLFIWSYHEIGDDVPLTVELDRSSPVPLYYQLAQAIEAAIRDGELSPGDRFENELALAKRLTLSRPTTRRAIQELVDKGLLVRERGATRAEAKLLDEKPGAPLLTMARTAFDDSGTAVEFGTHGYRASRYYFDTTLVDR